MPRSTKPAADGAVRQARDPRHRRHATAARHQRLGRSKPTPTPLIQYRIERRIAQFDRRVVNHARFYTLRVSQGILRATKLQNPIRFTTVGLKREQRQLVIVELLG